MGDYQRLFIISTAPASTHCIPVTTSSWRFENVASNDAAVSRGKSTGAVCDKRNFWSQKMSSGDWVRSGQVGLMGLMGSFRETRIFVFQKIGKAILDSSETQNHKNSKNTAQKIQKKTEFYH